ASSDPRRSGTRPAPILRAIARHERSVSDADVDTRSAYEVECQRRKDVLDAIEERLFKTAVQLAVVEFDTKRTMDEYRAENAKIDAARAKRLEEERERLAQDAARA